MENKKMSIQGQKFISEDEENKKYEEQIRIFEEEFNVKENEDLLENEEIYDYITIDLNRPEYENDEYEVNDNGNTGYAYVEDFGNAKITNIEYYISKDNYLHLFAEFKYEGSGEVQYDYRSSGNYYEPDDWSSFDIDVEAYGSLDVKIPDDPKDYTSYEFDEDDLEYEVI